MIQGFRNSTEAIRFGEQATEDDFFLLELDYEEVARLYKEAVEKDKEENEKMFYACAVQFNREAIEAYQEKRKARRQPSFNKKIK